LTSERPLRLTEVLNPTVNADITFKHSGVPPSAATIDQDQGDQSVVLVEDSFLDIDEPEPVSRLPTGHPPTALTYLSDILGTLLKTAREIKHN
jgi:hypothetical protein